jgi:hypothetical protein
MIATLTVSTAHPSARERLFPVTCDDSGTLIAYGNIRVKEITDPSIGHFPVRKEFVMSGYLPRLDRRRFLGAAGATAGRFGPAGVAAQEKIKLALRHDVAVGPLLEPYV